VKNRKKSFQGFLKQDILKNCDGRFEGKENGVQKPVCTRISSTVERSSLVAGQVFQGIHKSTRPPGSSPEAIRRHHPGRSPDSGRRRCGSVNLCGGILPRPSPWNTLGVAECLHFQPEGLRGQSCPLRHPAYRPTVAGTVYDSNVLPYYPDSNVRHRHAERTTQV
jgi:hypothetical protein